MPMFEFQCSKCDEIFEELVFDESVPPCPNCKAGETQKILSCACIHGGKSPSGYGGASGGGSSCKGCPGGSCATCH